MSKKSIKIAFLGSLVFLLALPNLVSANVIPESGPQTRLDVESVFEVVDEYRDVADLGGGKKTMRIYSAPRPTYVDSTGEKKVRPQGWGKFDEDTRSKLNSSSQIGYEFNIPLKENNEVLVRSSQLEIKKQDGKRSFSVLEEPTKTRFNQKKSDHDFTVSQFSDIYKGIDINFIDRTMTRTKEIILKQKPDLVQGEDMIFWEEYIVPFGAEIFVGDTKYRGEISTFDPIYIILDTGERMTIDVSIVYDSKFEDESYCDLAQEPVEMIVSYDNNKVLKTGLIVKAQYLLDKNRVYPVIVDPSYSTCTSASCIQDFYLKWLTGKSSETDGYLFMGYDYASGSGVCTPAGHASRHPVFKFNVDSIPDGSTVTDADIYLRGKLNGNGCGEYTGTITMKPKKINTSWTYSNITYNNIRAGLATGGSTKSIDSSTCNNVFCSWDLYNSMVQSWVDTPSQNYGFLIEPSTSFSSGSVPPADWTSQQKLFIFYSSNYGSSYSPYLTVSYTEPVTAKPDITKISSDINKTTFYPGETLTHDITVKNTGGTDASTYGYIYYYFEKGSRSYTTTYKKGSDSFGTLAVGASSAEYFEFDIPTDATPGTYYFYYWIDATERIDEESENNNKFYRTITVEEELKPDLIVQSTSLSKSSVYPNESLTAYATVKNQGTASAGSSVMGYYLSTNNTWSSSDTPLYQSESVSSLSAGSSSSKSRSLTIPSSWTNYGTNYIIFKADINGSVSESNESNNTAYVSFTINEPQTYDFTATNGAITSGGTLYGGNQINYQFQIQNLGTADASGVTYSAGIKNILTGETFGLLNESPSSWSLYAGYNNYQAMSAGIQDNCSMPYEANYKVSVTLDQNNNFSETNESNNVAETSNSIKIRRYSTCSSGGGGGGSTPTPDFDSDSYYDPEEYFAGTKITAVDAKPIKDPLYASYMSKSTDLVAFNYGADPVNIRTGAFEFTQTDFQLPGRGESINFTRTYNSKLFDRNNRMGNGWSHSYNIYFYQDPTTKNVQLYLGGALATSYTTTDGGQTFTPPAGEFDDLYLENGKLVYKKLNGIKYIFSNSTNSISENMGVLEQIVDTNGNTTNLSYTSVREMPLLTSVADASNRSIIIFYGPEADDAKWDKIVSVRDNVNPANPVIINYGYDSNGNLTTVSGNRIYNGVAETINKSFVFTADGKMLEYTDPRGTVLYNTFDSEGRVTEQWEHNPNKDASGVKRKVYTLDYQGASAEAPGSTHCTYVKNYRDTINYWYENTCFNADELKIYNNTGGSVERWAYDSSGMPATYTNPEGDITSYQYDAKKRLAKQVLPNVDGWHTEYDFVYEDNFNRLTNETQTAVKAGSTVIRDKKYRIDNKGNVTSTVDAEGIEEKFEYDVFGNVSKYINKKNQTFSYSYDVLKNYLLFNTTTVNGQYISQEYQYDVYGNKTRFIDPKNNTYRYEYDTAGNLRKLTNPDNTYSTYQYDLENHKIAEVNELSQVTNYEYDKDINASLISVDKLGTPSSISIRKEYDWLGNLVKDIDELNRQTIYTYDSANRIIIKQTPIDTINYTYYPDGQLKTETNSIGQKTEYIYDVRNNLIETRYYTDTINYISTKNIYDGFNRVVATVDVMGNTTTYKYNLNDWLTEETDPNGKTMIYGYDNNGNKNIIFDKKNEVAVVHTFDAINRLLRTDNKDNKRTVYEYDSNSNLTKIIDHQNQNGTSNTHVTEYTYNSRNRKKTEKDAYNNLVSFTYDGLGNLKTVADQMNRISTYYYDDFNRLDKEKDNDNNYTDYDYDKAGNKTSITYPGNKTTNYFYDNGNRLTTTTDHNLNTRVYSYDAVGNKLSEKDKKGFITRFTYDKLNRLKTETNPQGTITTYTYDNNGNKLSTDVAGKTTVYTYDNLNRNIAIAFPYGGSENYQYDILNNLVTSTDREGNVVVYGYDNLNRAITKTLSNFSIISYNYDNWNNVLTVIEPELTTGYIYDNLNRLRTENKVYSDFATTTYSIIRTYHPDSSLSTLTDASGTTITYNYDNRGLLNTVAGNTTTLATYTYTSMSRPETLTYSNGTVNTYTYDNLHRLDTLNITNGTTTLFSHDYDYDAESNRTQLNENGKITNYGYDNLGQLKTVYNNNQSIGYNYDKWGNRTYLFSTFGTTTYNYDTNSNLLNSYIQNHKTVDLNYNNNGSLTQEVYSNGSTVNYNWNTQNQLAGITYQYSNLPDNTLAFVYDDNGNRIKKTTNNQSTYYINNGLRVLNELDSNGGTTKTLIYGLSSQGGSFGEQIAELDNTGKLTFIHSDVLGSTVLLTDENGLVVGQYEYDAFGAVNGYEGSEETNYLFTNQEFDPESELYYYNARYYNPVIGRFISQDPVLGRAGDVLSRNGYIYVKNNPLKYTDPTGEIEKDFCSLYEKELYWEQGTKTFSAYIKDSASAVKNYTTGVLDSYSDVQYDTADFFYNVRDYNYQNGNIIQKAGGFISGAIGDLFDNSAKLFDPDAGALQKAGAGALLFLDVATGGGKSQAVKKPLVQVTKNLADDVIVDTYKVLKQTSKNTGNEVHHLIGKRFADLFGITPNQMPSVTIDKVLHQDLTNLWRKAIPYGSGTKQATKEQVENIAKEVYKNTPSVVDSIFNFLK